MELGLQLMSLYRGNTPLREPLSVITYYGAASTVTARPRAPYSPDKTYGLSTHGVT